MTHLNFEIFPIIDKNLNSLFLIQENEANLVLFDLLSIQSLYNKLKGLTSTHLKNPRLFFAGKAYSLEIDRFIVGTTRIAVQQIYYGAKYLYNQKCLLMAFIEYFKKNRMPKYEDIGVMLSEINRREELKIQKYKELFNCINSSWVPVWSIEPKADDIKNLGEVLSEFSDVDALTTLVSNYLCILNFYTTDSSELDPLKELSNL